MANSESASDASTFKRSLETRSVFISHAHADRKLAKGLGDVVLEAFSGLVRPFISSDPTPGGGIDPGDDWYGRIHEELASAESVWALATPTSLQRPWIYWEAGAGRAACPGAIVVLCVGVKPGDVPSPLSNFKAYDGSATDGSDVRELLGKVGFQIGMTISPVLSEAVAKKWLTMVGDYEPDTEEDVVAPTITPEQVNRIEALLSRLEAAPPPARAGLARRDAARRRLVEAAQAERMREDALRNELLGTVRNVFDDFGAFLEMLEATPEDCVISVQDIDEDGDLQFSVRLRDETAPVWLRGAALEGIGSVKRDGYSSRVAKVVEKIAAAVSDKS